jgi:hypothetical protein
MTVPLDRSLGARGVSLPLALAGTDDGSMSAFSSCRLARSPRRTSG